MNRSQRLIPPASVLALAFAAIGCGGGEAPPPPPPVERAKPPVAAQPATPPADATTTTTADGTATTTTTTEGTATTTTTVIDPAQFEPILAAADMADGTADKVVSKCAGCKLGMDGKAEHSVAAHGYTLHFCSAECKAKSEPAMDSVISALKM